MAEPFQASDEAAHVLCTRTGERGRPAQAVEAYRSPRAAWIDVIRQGRVCRGEITVGGEPWLRGHRADRLPAIEADLGDMAAELAATPAERGASATLPLASLARPPPPAENEHTPPASFERGLPVPVELGVRLAAGARPSVTLHDRDVNQAEPYELLEMTAEHGRFRATIPAAYTETIYPLRYFFELRTGPRMAWLCPGLGDHLANRPYVVDRQASAVPASSVRG